MTSQRVSATPLRIALYFGGDPSIGLHNTFFLNLFWQLRLLCRERGIECQTFFDRHPEQDCGEALPEMAEAVKTGRVNAVIAAMVSSAKCISWIDPMGLPFAIHYNSVKDDRVVVFDFRQMIRIALRALADHECPSVGLILPFQFSKVEMVEFIRSTAKRLGIVVEYEWMLFSDWRSSNQTPEEAGYDLFRTLWNLKKRPHGLIVFPDVVVRGVVAAIMENRIQQNLRLILHRNAESSIMVPLEVDWLESSARNLAEALLLQIERQRDGKRIKSMGIPFKLVSGVRERAKNVFS